MTKPITIYRVEALTALIPIVMRPPECQADSEGTMLALLDSAVTLYLALNGIPLTIASIDERDQLSAVLIEAADRWRIGHIARN